MCGAVLCGERWYIKGHYEWTKKQVRTWHQHNIFFCCSIVVLMYILLILITKWHNILSYDKANTLITKLQNLHQYFILSTFIASVFLPNIQWENSLKQHVIPVKAVLVNQLCFYKPIRIFEYIFQAVKINTSGSRSHQVAGGVGAAGERESSPHPLRS